MVPMFAAVARRLMPPVRERPLHASDAVCVCACVPSAAINGSVFCTGDD